jgi:hypothetical protein
MCISRFVDERWEPLLAVIHELDELICSQKVWSDQVRGRVAVQLPSLDLGSDQFKVREQATKELEKLSEVAAPALHKALAGDVSLEIKRRLEALSEELANWPAETLRAVRAVEVLEHVGTPAARAVLEGLALDGAPEARLTREAEGALRRMKLPSR